MEHPNEWYRELMPKEVTFRKGSPEVELYRKVHAGGDAQAHRTKRRSINETEWNRQNMVRVYNIGINRKKKVASRISDKGGPLYVGLW